MLAPCRLHVATPMWGSFDFFVIDGRFDVISRDGIINVFQTGLRVIRTTASNSFGETGNRKLNVSFEIIELTHYFGNATSKSNGAVHNDIQSSCRY